MKLVLRRGFRWLFRDRATGKVAIAQVPNLPLALFVLAAAWRSLAEPQGVVGTVLSAAGAVALLWWAAAELAAGVNPFRRFLGGAVLVATIVGLLG